MINKIFKRGVSNNAEEGEREDSESYKLTPGLPPVLPMPSTEFKNDFFNLSSSTAPSYGSYVPPMNQSKNKQPNKPTSSKS